MYTCATDSDHLKSEPCSWRFEAVNRFGMEADSILESEDDSVLKIERLDMERFEGTN
jgi:hypothetical protein